MASTPSSLAERGQRLGLKLIAKAGGLPALQDPERRKKVERLLYRGAVSGFKAQTAAGRAFARQKGSGDPARAATTKPSTPTSPPTKEPTAAPPMINISCGSACMTGPSAPPVMAKPPNTMPSRAQSTPNRPAGKSTRQRVRPGSARPPRGPRRRGRRGVRRGR